MAARQVLVTVGTTKFDLFISTVCSPDVLRILKEKGYFKLLIQIGNGSFIPPEGMVEGMQIEYFRFKNSIVKDIEDSALVLSHAGAGSCLEVLYAKKPLIVVVNELLMNNHQIELAHQLFAEGHAFYCTCQELLDTLKNMDLDKLRPFALGNPEKFVHFLDNIFGFENTISIS